MKPVNLFRNTSLQIYSRGYGRRVTLLTVKTLTVWLKKHESWFTDHLP